MINLTNTARMATREFGMIINGLILVECRIRMYINLARPVIMGLGSSVIAIESPVSNAKVLNQAVPSMAAASNV